MGRAGVLILWPGVLGEEVQGEEGAQTEEVLGVEEGPEVLGGPTVGLEEWALLQLVVSLSLVSPTPAALALAAPASAAVPAPLGRVHLTLGGGG